MDTVPLDIKMQCAVCQNKATGRHYGVFSCFGCKSFWRRSIWHNRRYKCKFSGTCPMRRICQNICRACRLQRCYHVGMLPCAVKAERRNMKRQLTNLNIVNSGNVKERSQSRASGQTETLSTNLTNETPDVLTPLFPKHFLETTSLWLSMIDEELLNESENITTLFRLVSNRIDSPTFTVISPQSNSVNVISNIKDAVAPASYCVIPFSDAFYHPELVGRRSKIDISGFRNASVQDADDCWKRCFILYADLMTKLTQFIQIPYDDQISLARHRFYVFYWWITATWTIKTKCDGICYSNGSFVKTKNTNQDSKSSAYLHYNRFIQPLAELNCSDFELIAIFLLAFFHQTKTAHVSDSTYKSCNLHNDKLRKMLFFHIFGDNLKKGDIALDEHDTIQELYLRATVRCSLLSQFSGALLELVEFATGNDGLQDLYVINWNNIQQSENSNV